MVHVKVEEMEKAFLTHRTSYDTLVKCRKHKTAYLILFYLVEFGLKSIYMRRHRVSCTSNLREPFLSHDLEAISQALRLPYRFPRIRSHDGRHIPLKDLHTAWRYGKRLDHDDERRITESLESILKDLDKKVRGI